jgi:hypothetical protein
MIQGDVSNFLAIIRTNRTQLSYRIHYGHKDAALLRKELLCFLRGSAVATTQKKVAF